MSTFLNRICSSVKVWCCQNWIRKLDRLCFSYALRQSKKFWLDYACMDAKNFLWGGAVCCLNKKLAPNLLSIYFLNAWLVQVHIELEGLYLFDSSITYCMSMTCVTIVHKCSICNNIAHEINYYLLSWILIWKFSTYL